MNKEVIILEDLETAKDLKRYIDEDIPNSNIEYLDEGMLYTDDDYEVTIPKQFQHIFENKPKKKTDYSDALIFGKNQLEEITAIEIKDNKVFIFLNNGDVETKPMIYWMLSDRKLDANFTRLDGNQHYKFMRRFSNKKQFMKFYSLYKKKNKDVYTIWNDKESAMIYYGYTMFKGLKVEDVSVLSFDIEAEGLAKHKDSQVFLITNTFRGSDGEITKKHFRVDHYESDVEMIEDWCKWVVKVDPTVITGHNIFGYDAPYLQYCYADRDGRKGTLPLGKFGEPVEISQKESQFRVDGNQTWSYNKMHVYGRHLIDGMFLAVRYDIGRNYVSWGLKSIAEHEGFVKEDRQFYDASLIGKNWSDPIEREKIVAYGIDDSDDSLAIYDLMIPSVFYMTQSVPKPLMLMHLSASGAQLNAILVRAYLQDNHSIPKTNEREPVAGGISFGVHGVHKNVFKIDVKSEYPSVIRKFRVRPLLKDPKQYYTTMVDYFTEKRFEQKRMHEKTGEKYYDDLQAASKIFINSSYGIMGTSGLNFNDFKAADFITGMGRQIIKESLKWATGKHINHWWNDYENSKDELYDGELFMKDTYEEYAKRKKLYT